MKSPTTWRLRKVSSGHLQKPLKYQQIEIQLLTPDPPLHYLYISAIIFQGASSLSPSVFAFITIFAFSLFFGAW